MPSRRGFAGMSPEKRRYISSLGGKAAHAKGTAHEYTKAEARNAGRIGGRVVSLNRQHMSEIGRIGGRNSAGKPRFRKERNQFDASPQVSAQVTLVTEMSKPMKEPLSLNE
jgi:general stress protein YciG